MAKEIAWVDREYKQLEMNEIDDRYLVTILKFLCRGGGYTSFVSLDKIKALFAEADRRGISHNAELQTAIDSYRIKIFAEDDIYRYLDEEF